MNAVIQFDFTRSVPRLSLAGLKQDSHALLSLASDKLLATARDLCDSLFPIAGRTHL